MHLGGGGGGTQPPPPPPDIIALLKSVPLSTLSYFVSIHLHCPEFRAVAHQYSNCTISKPWTLQQRGLSRLSNLTWQDPFMAVGNPSGVEIYEGKHTFYVFTNVSSTHSFHV